MNGRDSTTTEKATQLHIQTLQREIAEVEQIKENARNETAKESLDLYIENLRREVHRLESL